MQLISRWGAEPEVRRLGFGCEYAMSIRSCLTGPEIQRVPLDGHVWACAQDHLETILAKRAAAAGARLRYGAELTGLHPAGQEMRQRLTSPRSASTAEAGSRPAFATRFASKPPCVAARSPSSTAARVSACQDGVFE
jgi:hypothetical protein